MCKKDSKTTKRCLFPLPRSVLFFLASAFRSSATDPEAYYGSYLNSKLRMQRLAQSLQMQCSMYVLVWFRSISDNGLELDLDLRFEALALVKLGNHHQNLGNHHQTTGEADLLVASDFFCRATSCPGAAMARAGASKA